MSHEIEIKLTYTDRIKVTEKLKEVGAEPIKKFTLSDIYFSLNGKDMSNTNDLIRIRTKNNSSELTLKGKCEAEGNIWKRVELSSGISDPTKVREILEFLNFNFLSENKSEREKWMLKDTEIMFIDFTFPEKLNVLEIEAPSSNEIKFLLGQLQGLVTEVGEESFKKFDESRKQ